MAEDERKVMGEEVPPRPLDAIFADLKALAQSESALHEVSALIYRDWVLTVDTVEGKVVDEPGERWSTDKLNKNELLLLMGLLVQGPDDRTYGHVPGETDFAEHADRLFREFHERINEDARAVMDLSSPTFLEKPETLGPFAREAIYYGSESFYLHQFGEFARHRYRQDGDWLLQNVGISIRPILEIAHFVVERMTFQMSNIGQLKARGETLNKGDLTSSLLISKAELRKRFGAKSDRFIARFATPVSGANAGFDNPFQVNDVAKAPLIDLGDNLFVSHQYRLFESVYESPFYWMVLDPAYEATLAAHRGAFLEESAAHVMRRVFGAENVFVNARFPEATGQKGEEIDVLVRYGEFLIVVQAKSKRVTLKARAGDVEALRRDFKGAIQDPYDQAVASCEMIAMGLVCVDANGKAIQLPKLARVFPLALLGDPFPAVTALSRGMLKRPEGSPAPVVWDLGVLDCVARLLPTPIELLFYLQARGEVFDKVVSDSEYNFLGFHINAKLALPPDYDFMLLERDFAGVVDDYMISADMGLEVERPRGVLEDLGIPVARELLEALKAAPPDVAAIVVDLYDFSGAALARLAGQIAAVRKEVRTTGKAIKAFSIESGSGGLTYAVIGSDVDERSAAAAQAIGRKHKYQRKADRWYVILDSVRTDRPVDALLPLVWPWKEDEDEAASSEVTGRIFGSREIQMPVGGAPDDEQSDEERTSTPPGASQGQAD